MAIARFIITWAWTWVVWCGGGTAKKLAARARTRSSPLVVNYITYRIAILHENACDCLMRHSDNLKNYRPRFASAASARENYRRLSFWNRALLSRKIIITHVVGRGGFFFKNHPSRRFLPKTVIFHTCVSSWNSISTFERESSRKKQYARIISLCQPRSVSYSLFWSASSDYAWANHTVFFPRVLCFAQDDDGESPTQSETEIYNL